MSSALSTKKTFRDRAIVLRTQNLADYDRILILATPSSGLLHAVAQGIRKPSSKFGARLEPFMFVDFEAVRGRSLATISQVVTRRPFAADLATDYGRYTLALVMAEVTEQILKHRQADSDQEFSLLLGALGALTEGRLSPYRVLDSFLLRMMHQAGWSMAIAACASDSDHGQGVFFSPQVGLICRACAQAGLYQKLSPLAAGSALYLSDLALGRWERLGEDLPLAFCQTWSDHIMDYVEWQLERPLKARAIFEKETR